MPAMMPLVLSQLTSDQVDARVWHTRTTSCKRRGICSSCAGRHMNDVATHLVESVLPPVAIRQWVLTLPYSLRYRLAYDRKLLTAVLDAFIKSVFASQRRRAKQHYGVKTRTQPGA